MKTMNDNIAKNIKKCSCDDTQCAKCLSMNCEDKECRVHTKEKKQDWRKRWETSNYKPFPNPKNY